MFSDIFSDQPIDMFLISFIAECLEPFLHIPYLVLGFEGFGI